MIDMRVAAAESNETTVAKAAAAVIQNMKNPEEEAPATKATVEVPKMTDDHPEEQKMMTITTTMIEIDGLDAIEKIATTRAHVQDHQTVQKMNLHIAARRTLLKTLWVLWALSVLLKLYPADPPTRTVDPTAQLPEVDPDETEAEEVMTIMGIQRQRRNKRYKQPLLQQPLKLGG